MSSLEGSSRKPLLVTSGLVWFVRAYQHLVSPVLPPCCRYTPSCSEYAIQALRKHGMVRGLALAAARLCRCNPWAEGGEDLVP